MRLNDFQLISLAGLLHDTGKLKHRAGYEVLNEYNKMYCPENEFHKSKCIHAAHTADFLDWFTEEFKIQSENSELNLVNIASNHHKNSDDPFEEIIRKANRLSSGFEREELDNSGTYNKDKLESIFSQLYLNKKPTKYYYPLEKLSFDVVPTKDSVSDDAKLKYENLYKCFVNDLKKIDRNTDFDVFWDSLEYLYEIYAWSVPSSSYFSYPRISLFDHSKTTAAIAQALYGFHKSGNTLSVDKIRSIKEREFLLVQGDFAGIQNFIFSRMGESNKFAAKILRARSFFVSLATDLAAYDICKRAGLTKAAIVMNAGGKFTLLLPNTPESIKSVYGVEQGINDYFEDITFGETKFVIEFVEASDSDFKSDSFARKMEEVVHELEVKKLRSKPLKIVFDGYLDSVSENGVCKVCGKHAATTTEDSTPICKYCSEFKKIGESLVKSNYFSVVPYAGRMQIVKGYGLVFKKDSKAYLIYDLKNDDVFRGLAKSRIAGYVPRISQDEVDIKKYNDDEGTFEEGEIKTFHMLSEDAKRFNESGDLVGEGFLGILKADVDNLGRIFVEGFKGNVSISKIVSLSRMMDFFFTGWLQNKLKQRYTSVYTVFSGGDDLFLIGPFDQIIDLALEIDKHLKEYTKNEDIHLSCGVYFAKDKIPVYQMAQRTEDILEEAKSSGKNRIGIFGRVITWDRFEKMIEDEKFVQLLDRVKEKSWAFVYSLFWYIHSAERALSSVSKKNISEAARDMMWKPLFVYQVYRNLGGKKGDDTLKEEFLDYFVELIQRFGGDLHVALSNYVYRNRRV